MRCRFLPLVLLTPGLALADGPVDGVPGMARIVDGPELKAAFARAKAGEVEITFGLTNDGAVKDARVVRASPPGVFDAAAMSMVMGARLRATPNSFDTGSEPALHDVIIHFSDTGIPQAWLDTENVKN